MRDRLLAYHYERARELGMTVEDAAVYSVEETNNDFSQMNRAELAQYVRGLTWNG